MKTTVHLILVICVAMFFVQVTRANGEVSWPYGKYGLPKSKSGCPEETWQKGWRKQDVTGWSRLSVDSQIDVQRPGFNRTFCVKNYPGVAKTRLWPKGFYCIYKARNSSCPTGMTQGSVKWDDKNVKNTNQHGGVLPDGVYDSDTQINYCCQEMGKWFDPIELPIDRPFYLLPHNNRASSFPYCQHVKWTMSWLEYIDYDAAGDDKSRSGDHVFNEILRFDVPFSRTLVRVYYCYYQGCRFEMNKNEGVLSSPKLSNDPQFIKCSWMITVKKSLVVSIQFIRLNHCLQSTVFIYDGINETSPLLGRYCDLLILRQGHKVVSSGNQVLVVFSSRRPRENLKTRPNFVAKYSAINPDSTPSTKPPSHSQSSAFNVGSTNHTSSTRPIDQSRNATNVKSRNQSSCSESGLLAGLVVVSLLLIIMIILIIFRGKVTQFLEKLRSHTNSNTKEMSKAEVMRCKAKETTTFENGTFALSNNENEKTGRVKRVGGAVTQDSDEDNYMDLITENIQPESNYQSLRGNHKTSQNVQNTDVDDYVIACVDTKQRVPEDSTYEYPDV